MNPFRTPENAHLPGPHLSWVNWGSVNFACILRWGIQDMHHNVRREWLAKASCHIFVRGKGTLFANFPSWALTGCFVFRPLVTSMASQLLVQVKCFFLLCSPPPHCKAAEIRTVRLTSRLQNTGWRILDEAHAPCGELFLPGLSYGQTALRADGSQSFLVKVTLSTPLHQNLTKWVWGSHSST